MNADTPSADRPTASAGFSWFRLRALVRKESRQMRRDPSTLLVGVFLPMLLLLIFGYGLSLDVKDVPVVVVLEDSSPEASELAAGFRLSPFFQTSILHDFPEAEARLRAREAEVIVRVRDDFSVRVQRGEAAPVQVLINGVDANRARSIQVHVQGALAQWSLRQRDQGRPVSVDAVQVQPRLWFNEDNNSRHFLVPGLIVLVMTLIGAFLTALVVAREWERGTFESLFVTPVRPLEILLGKALPYFCLGMFGFALCVVVACFLFEVPLRGSLWILTLGAMLYLVVALGIGLLISSATKNQFVATQLAILVSFLPATMLSGFLFDIRSMPAPLQFLTNLVPARHFVSFVQSEFLAGDVLPLIVRSLAVLAFMGLVLMVASTRKIRKRLE